LPTRVPVREERIHHVTQVRGFVRMGEPFSGSSQDEPKNNAKPALQIAWQTRAKSDGIGSIA
jgi:hypothetical protein